MCMYGYKQLSKELEYIQPPCSRGKTREEEGGTGKFRNINLAESECNHS